jgi:hypothetical protein
MDPKEYRRIFRRAQFYMRDIIQAASREPLAASKLLEDFELAYEAECDSTEALQCEVAVLTERVQELKTRLNSRHQGLEEQSDSLQALLASIDRVEVLHEGGANAIDMSEVFEARKVFL